MELRKKTFLLLLILFLRGVSFSQNTYLEERYNKSLNEIRQLLINNGPFKKAVFTSETAFLNDDSIEVNMYSTIDFLKYLCYGFGKSITANYCWTDSFTHKQNLSIFTVITDTSYILIDTSLESYKPFIYSYSDPMGKKDYSNMLVTKLLATHQGNCHSLAYLYKILADEIGAKCWLALAPGHIYIRNYCEQSGWYNTELTSKSFPTDAWIMATTYVSPQAVKSGLYMDTLSNQQSIALCVLDLAKEYEYQTHDYYDGFILKCCDLVLQYHAVDPMALLLKAETLKKIYLKQRGEKYPRPTTTFNEMQNTYVTLARLGYREVPDKKLK